MTDYIICRKNEGSYTQIDFYVKTRGREIFLFSQHYSTLLYDRYKKPVYVSDALRYGKGGKAMTNFKEKLPKYIKYIEMEEGIDILEKTKQKKEKRKTAAA